MSDFETLVDRFWKAIFWHATLDTVMEQSLSEGIDKQTVIAAWEKETLPCTSANVSLGFRIRHS